jgi:hypothetical protein
LVLWRQVIQGDIHDIMNIRHLDQLDGPTGRAKKCVDAKISTSHQAHNKPNKAGLTHVLDPKRASQFS